MYLSHTLTGFMDKREVDYETVGHSHCFTSGESAQAAHLSRTTWPKRSFLR